MQCVDPTAAPFASAARSGTRYEKTSLRSRSNPGPADSGSGLEGRGDAGAQPGGNLGVGFPLIEEGAERAAALTRIQRGLMRSAETEHGQKLEPHEGNSAAIELCAVSEAVLVCVDR